MYGPVEGEKMKKRSQKGFQLGDFQIMAKLSKVLSGSFSGLSELSPNQLKRIENGMRRAVREVTFVPKNPGRRARTKGHSFEREVAIQLREVFPDARRHLEYQDQEANGVDLVETGEYRIQCKRLKGYASVNTIEEISSDRIFGEVPVLVTQADGKEAMAVLPFSDLVRLMRNAR